MFLEPVQHSMEGWKASAYITTVQQHPPCSVITATGDEAANSAMYSLVRDAIVLR